MNFFVNLSTELSILFSVLGIIFLLAGSLLKRFPPASPNYLYGYRTRASMKSQEQWDFAQTHSANSMIRLGWVHCLLAVSALFLPIPPTYGLIGGLLLSLILMVLLVRHTEKAIAKRFPED